MIFQVGCKEEKWSAARHVYGTLRGVVEIVRGLIEKCIVLVQGDTLYQTKKGCMSDTFAHD